MAARMIRLRRATQGEGGFAMVTAVLAILVATILGATVMQLSFHTTQASAYDRSRTQAIHAAESGLDRMMATFETAATLPCTLAGTLSATPVANWSVAITYYPSYPLIGTPMACAGGYLAGGTAPGGAELVSTGSVVGWPTGTVERHMEMQVQLGAVHGAFNKAIFSNGPPAITNNITILGDNGNNADFITNSNWACTNSLTVYGSIYVQGTADLSNSCRAVVDLWANGAITMSSSSRVDHDAKSSTGSLTMSQSASVGNNATVGTTCSGCAGRVGGTITTGNVQPAPPTSTFPTMIFDATAWTTDGWSIQYFTDCTAARSWLTSGANNASKTVLRITGGCTLTFQNNTTVTRTADVAIFTDGGISASNNTTFASGDGTWHNLLLTVESAASCAGTNGRITMSNQTSFDHEYFLLYSPCYTQFGQNNSSARGQIYGQVVTTSNNLTFTFHAMDVPGAGDVTGYRAGTAFVREVN